MAAMVTALLLWHGGLVAGLEILAALAGFIKLIKQC